MQALAAFRSVPYLCRQPLFSTSRSTQRRRIGRQVIGKRVRVPPHHLPATQLLQREQRRAVLDVPARPFAWSGQIHANRRAKSTLRTLQTGDVGRSQARHERERRYVCKMRQQRIKKLSARNTDEVTRAATRAIPSALPQLQDAHA
jgi:hypothetical protein